MASSCQSTAANVHIIVDPLQVLKIGVIHICRYQAVLDLVDLLLDLPSHVICFDFYTYK